MLTINLICIGKLKEDYLKKASSEYEKRLSAFCRLNIIELSEYRLPNEPSVAEIEKCIKVEGEAIFPKLKGEIFSLCIEGDHFSSEELSKKISNLCVFGTSEISFVIGGSNGLCKTIKDASNLKLSMSKMTFPHQLARIMLLEQIYRTFQINNKTKYHK